MRRIDRRTQGEAIVAFEDAVFLEQLGEELGDAEPLEDAGIGPVGEVGQARHQFDAITGQAVAGIPLGDGSDLTVDTRVPRAQAEKGAAMQQRFQRPVRSFADQLQLEAVGPTDGLGALEGEDLEIMGDAIQRQGELRGIGWSEHRIASLRIENAHVISQTAQVQAARGAF